MKTAWDHKSMQGIAGWRAEKSILLQAHGRLHSHPDLMLNEGEQLTSFPSMNAVGPVNGCLWTGFAAGMISIPTILAAMSRFKMAAAVFQSRVVFHVHMIGCPMTSQRIEVPGPNQANLLRVPSQPGQTGQASFCSLFYSWQLQTFSTPNAVQQRNSEPIL